ncbi:Charged multivesicular body protein 6 [Intoshia linei]|uniref:Charged multivesicular body protein 6 n=1 Tax=Intoshia linei TaxID=1819745 RepID=A0A177AWY0_9BILA|nr:Charged multivesicular body protein 6 [Intoshia linei]
MGNIFKRKSQITETDRALLQLKVLRDKYGLQEKQIEKIVNTDKEYAVKYKKMGQNQKALFYFKRFKMNEKQLEKLYINMTSINQCIDNVQDAQAVTQFTKCISEGNIALKNVLKYMCVNKQNIEQLVEESTELHHQVEELENVFDDVVDPNERSLLEQEFILLGKSVYDIKKEHQDNKINNEINKLPMPPIEIEKDKENIEMEIDLESQNEKVLIPV